MSVVVKGVITRKYRLIRYGNSYYLCIPKAIITQEMLKKGVIINILEATKNKVVLSLTTDESNREHDKSDKER